MPITFADIRDKVYAGTRLSFDDGLALEATGDLFTLGELANVVRERKNGNVTYYNVNEHLNPTNVCVYRCSFCSFRADLEGHECLRDDRRADSRPRTRGDARRAAPNCTSSAGCTTSCPTSGISASSPTSIASSRTCI